MGFDPWVDFRFRFSKSEAVFRFSAVGCGGGTNEKARIVSGVAPTRRRGLATTRLVFKNP
jgi:hypothetical protein